MTGHELPCQSADMYSLITPVQQEAHALDNGADGYHE